MQDDFAAASVAHGNDERIRDILDRVCEITGMGFAAVARVTASRWIICQVDDRIDFGLAPGDELKVQETICNEIRQCGEAIFIDHVIANEQWRAHPVPAQYGFQSYASIPLLLEDGSFYGTLCAIDPQPRSVSDETTVAVLTSCAQEVARLLSEKVKIG